MKMQREDYVSLDELLAAEIPHQDQPTEESDYGIQDTLVIGSDDIEAYANEMGAKLLTATNVIRNSLQQKVEQRYDRFFDPERPMEYVPAYRNIVQLCHEFPTIHEREAIAIYDEALSDAKAKVLVTRICEDTSPDPHTALKFLDRLSVSELLRPELENLIADTIVHTLINQDHEKYDLLAKAAEATVGTVQIEDAEPPVPANDIEGKLSILPGDSSAQIHPTVSVGFVRHRKFTSIATAISLAASTILAPGASNTPSRSESRLDRQPVPIAIPVLASVEHVKKLVQSSHFDSDAAIVLQSITAPVTASHTPSEATANLQILNEYLADFAAMQPSPEEQTLPSNSIEFMAIAPAEMVELYGGKLSPEQKQLAEHYAGFITLAALAHASMPQTLKDAISKRPKDAFVEQYRPLVLQRVFDTTVAQNQDQEMAATLLANFEMIMHPDITERAQLLEGAKQHESAVATEAAPEEAQAEPAQPQETQPVPPPTPEAPAVNPNGDVKIDIENYNGEIFSKETLELIQKNLPTYLQVAREKDIPWTMIAVIHYRETRNKLVNPGNGQGIYQFVDGRGGPYPQGEVTLEEFLRQTRFMADFLKEKAKNNNEGLRNLTADADPEAVKDTFFTYNGRAKVYMEQAKRLGFEFGRDGSPYVVNKIDDLRNPDTNPGGWGQVKRDFGPIEFPANDDYGAYVLYRELRLITGNPIPESPAPAPAPLEATPASGECPSGVIDLGIHEGSVKRETVNIRLCALPGVPSSSQESTPGSKYYVEGADGNAIVNVEIAAQAMQMFNDAKADGVDLRAVSTFRTKAHQTDLFNANPDPSVVAPPGRSNHEGAFAIDWELDGLPIRASAYKAADGTDGGPENPRVAPESKTWRWLSENAHKYGFKPYWKEPWHWEKPRNEQGAPAAPTPPAATPPAPQPSLPPQAAQPAQDNAATSPKNDSKTEQKEKGEVTPEQTTPDTGNEKPGKDQTKDAKSSDETSGGNGQEDDSDNNKGGLRGLVGQFFD